MRLESLLMQALSCELGLLIRTPDPESLRAALYRAKYKDPALSGLQIRLSPFPEGDLVICHNNTG